MKMRLASILAVALLSAIVCTASPAVAQDNQRLGADVFFSTHEHFGLGGHYNFTDLDSIRLGPITIPASQLWAFGQTGSSGFNLGGGVMFQLHPNKQISINVGPALTIAPKGNWAFGLALTFDITPKHNPPPAAPPVRTLISGL